MHKIIQRKLYDIFSTRNGVLTLVFSLALLGSSIFYFGEAIVEWSSEKYAVVFNSFSDNLLGKSFRTRLCLPVPIDVVYTWVNGTDPQLLTELRRTKISLEGSTNQSWSKRLNVTKCLYANCVKASIAVFPLALPEDVSKEKLTLISSQFSSVYKLETMESDDMKSNMTLAHFLSIQNVIDALKRSEELKESGFCCPVQAFYTSDVTIPNSKLQSNIVLVSGFKKDYSNDEISSLFPSYAMDKVFEFEMVGRIGVFRTATSREADDLMALAYNFTVDRRYLQFNRANLVYDLSYSGNEKDLSANRFEDNEELRYSLRSLEQYAPWVRHIYIVTNGQIPYWLNLDNPRLTVITHNEIFLNSSHLPTFSSPAIESNIHRIPGLSDKFLYLNDDVMFGAQVWPDDFYTHSKGQKVYLSWNIPDCAPGCPQSWLKDGFCDKACNVSACGFDAGDCGPGARTVGGLESAYHWAANNPLDISVCKHGCSDSWIADKYCDQACNSKECGFDAGDCGVDNFHHLYGVDMTADQHEYTIPGGISEAYLNFTSISKIRVTSATHSSDASVRVAAVSNKHKVLTLVLHTNKNETSFAVNITFGEKDDKDGFVGVSALSKMHPTIDTLAQDEQPAGKSEVSKEQIATQAKFVFDDVPLIEREPQVIVQSENQLKELFPPESLNISQLPDDLKQEVMLLHKAVDDDELTEKGYSKRLSVLLSSHSQGNMGRQLKTYVEHEQEIGFLPWEKSASFKALVKRRDLKNSRNSIMAEYLTSRRTHRHLMDTFSQSLHYVNGLYNTMFGVKARKVPGHIPHMIDKEVMTDLQEIFKEQWEMTSSHKIRDANDMQFAFSYFYFLMDSRRNNTEVDFIEEMDLDNSGVLSDRELRTMATRIFDSPLDLQSLLSLENHIINCSSYLPADKQEVGKVARQQPEMYYQTNLPQVTLTLLGNCEPVLQLIRNKVEPKSKYKYEVMGDSDIHFKMIGTNVSSVVGQLDDIRRHPRKFLCLNDNIDHNNPEAMQVKALLADFYEGLYPIRSQFELPAEYRNRFLHVDELREWKKYREYTKLVIEMLLVMLVLYTIYSFYEDKMKLNNERARRPRTAESV